MFIKYNDESVRLTGRWAMAEEGAITTACGSKLEFAFYGKSAVMHFGIGFLRQPYPHIWIEVDGGGRVEAAVEKYLRISCRDEGKHTVTVIFKSAVEMYHRWYEPLEAKLEFRGYEADEPARLTPVNKKYIEFVGDSITEGVLIDEDNRITEDSDVLNRPFQDDSTATYAYLTAEELGLEPIIMGYGGVGVSKGGSGSVPKAAEAYRFCYSGVYSEISPDYIVVNYGANDRSSGAEVYFKEYEDVLDVIRSCHPNAKIFVLSAFKPWCADEQKKFIEKYNKSKNCNIIFIDSSEWIPNDPLHPHRSGHKTVAKHLACKFKENGWLN